MDELIGTELGGCRIESLAGKGKLGLTFKGIQLSLNRPVAIKVFHPSVCEHVGYLERMKEEASLIASLSYPDMIQIYDTGHKHDIHYIIMEYVDASILRERVKEDGSFTAEQAGEICGKIAQGLEKAHKQGAVHGDISPHTVFVSGADAVKISDFGLAKGSAEAADLRGAGISIGDSAYMSPEQTGGGEADIRSDIYALGCTFYYMITGSAPFEEGHSADTSDTPGQRHVPAPEGESREVNAFISGCTAGDPEKRFPSYAEVLASLETIAQSTPDEQGFPGMAERTGPGSAEGEHTCPKCNTSFNGEPDFYNKATCPACLFSFEPGERAGDDFFDSGVQDDIVDSLLSGSSEETPAQAEHAGSQEQEKKEETLLAKVNRAIVIQPREALEIVCTLLEIQIERKNPSGILLPEHIIQGTEGDLSVSEEPTRFEDLTPEQAVFASPEFCRDEKPDESSDVYSLGMLFLFMISGHSPEAGNDLDTVRGFHEGHKDISVSAINPAVTNTCARIIHMMLGMKGEARITSLTEALELVRNECRRMDGEHIEDRVTKTPDDEEHQEDEEGEEETEEETEPVKGSDDESRVICTRCRSWNPPETFVCETCGKLLREENPKQEPETEEDFTGLTRRLMEMGNWETAYRICNEGLKTYFSSVDLKGLEQEIKDRVQASRIEDFDKKAGELASQKKFKEAIREWEKAGSVSGGSKAEHGEKIAWAHSMIRKKRLITVLVIVGVVIAGSIIGAVCFPERVFPFLSIWCRHIGLRIAFFEQYEPKGIENIDADENTDAGILLACLEKVQGKALSKEQERKIEEIRNLLVRQCRRRFKKRVSEADYFNFLDACSKYLKGTPQEKSLLTVKDEALAHCVDQCEIMASSSEKDCISALDNLRPFARGSRWEKEIDSLIDTYRRNLEAQEKRESPERRSALAELSRISQIERNGDYAAACLEYRKLLSGKKINGFPDIQETARLRIQHIESYQEKAQELLRRADSLFAKDKQNAVSLYRRIMKEYPSSAAVFRVKLPLTVKTDPENAEVYIDGRKQDTSSSRVYCSPYSAAVIEVRSRGYLPKKTVIADIPYPVTGPWCFSCTLFLAPEKIIHAGRHLKGIGNFGDVVYSAGKNAVFVFNPFKGNTRPGIHAYPRKASAEPFADLEWIRVEDRHTPYIRRNTAVMTFDPIMEKVGLIGTIEHTPVSPLTVASFFPKREKGLFFWDDTGHLICLKLKILSQIWRKRYKHKYTGTGLCPYKEHIITTHPKKECIVFMLKQNGDIEKEIPLPGKTHYFTVTDDQLYVCSRQGHCMRVDLIKKASEEWCTNLHGTVSAPVITSRVHFFALTGDGVCIAGYRRNGEIIWRRKVSTGQLRGGVFFKNKVYIYDLCGIIHVLSPKGEEKGRLYGQKDISSNLVIYNDKLLFITEKGDCIVYGL